VTGAEETLQQSQHSGASRRADRGGAWRGNHGDDPHTGTAGALPREHGTAASRPDGTDGSHEPGDPAGLPDHLRQMPSAASKQELPARLNAAQLQHDIVVAGIRVGDHEGFTAPDIVAHLCDSEREQDRRALSQRVLAAINDRLIPEGLVVDTGNTRVTPQQLDLLEKKPRAGGRPAKLFQVTEQGRQAVGLVNEHHSRVQASGANGSHSKNGAAGSQAPEQRYTVYRRRETDDGGLGWEEVV
jgi:hypothetical protein